MANAMVNRIAVLIDAENVSAKYVGPLLNEIARFGTATVKRIYGDWTLPDQGRWKQTLISHAIIPVHQFRLTTRKNSTDCALIIDAMDLLYTGKFEAFCLVSSDSDFTRLACRIRESGLLVYGFGEAKTPAPFVRACDRFIKLEDLFGIDTPGAAAMESKPETTKAKTHSEKAPGKAQPSKPANHNPALSKACSLTAAIKANHDLINLIKSTYDSVSQEDNWTPLGVLGDQLHKVSPSFKCKKYGAKSLGLLIQATGIFEIKMEPDPKQPKCISWFIKAK